MGWGGLRRLGGALFVAGLAVLGGCGGAEEPSAPAAASRVVKAASADAGTAFRGHGTWWNPAEPGTGFFFEAQVATGIVTFYVFDDAGRPIWYAANGPFTQSGTAFHFSGTLQRFDGGQPAGSPSPRQPTSTVIGPVSIVFEGDSAQVQLPGRSFTARKFYAGESSRTGNARSPETGVYWNPQESGRGYTVEADGDRAVITAFHYDATTGAPTWNLSVVPLARTSPSFNLAPFLGYTGGQTLAGPYRQPPVQTDEGSLGLSFSTACTGQLRFPRAFTTVTLKRFSFAGLSERDTCRAWSTLPDAQPLQYNSATLPSMGLLRGGSASGDLTVTFAFPLQDPQVVTAFADFSSRATVQMAGAFTPRWRWLSGALPPGMSFDEATGQLRGVATQGGEFTFEVAATVDGFGGQVAERQTLVVRPPLVSYLGFSGTTVPIVATSFEVDRFAFPAPLLTLRDAGSLHPMTLPSPVSVAWAVAEGSSLPPGLSFDPATSTISGTPRTLAQRHDTIFEARLTFDGTTTTVQGVVPFRIHATGAAASPGRVEYETLPLLATFEDLQAQLNTQGARGFRYLARVAFAGGGTAAVYVRDRNDWFEYQLAPAMNDVLALGMQLTSMANQGFRWAAAIGPNYQYDAYVREGSARRWDLTVLPWGTTAIGQMLTRLNSQGAVGASYAGHRTMGREIVSLHERELAGSARYEYAAASEDPRTQSDFTARLNAQGARGYRLRPVEVPPVNLAAGAAPPRIVVWEKDASQGATFHYATRTMPATEAEFLLAANEEGRTGGILAAHYVQLGMPGALVFVRPLQCRGVICQPGPFMPQ